MPPSHPSTPALVFAALAICALPLPAVERFVTPSGNATNPGTEVSPWSLAKAASSALAGDTVFIAGGTYTSRISITVSGTASAPIVFRAKEGEEPILDQNGIAPPANESAVLLISSRNYITVQGLTVRNYRTTSQNSTPIGIHVSGTCQGVELRDNHIYAIEQNNATLGNFDANGHGMLIEGTSGATALDGIVIDHNVLHDLHLGASEAMAINGNVTHFRVTRNTVHHCNNIGIDLIGYEGTASSNDRARDGLVAGNNVYAIDSSFNPSYGGNLSTGGGDSSAAGIYVDGGTRIVIEQNLIHSSNFGVEIAAENGSGFSDYITLRNNLIRHNQGAGLTIGGYDSQRGATEHCTFEGNTFYQNDIASTGGGQITFQYYVRNNTFSNNILWAQRSNRQMVMQTSGNKAAGAIGTGNSFGYNLYFYEGAGASPVPVFKLHQSSGNQTYSTLASWQSSSGMGDAGATFEDPAFILPVPTPTSPPSDFKPTDSSPAINTGAPTFAPAAGERDYFQQSRVRAGRVDRGMAEN